MPIAASIPVGVCLVVLTLPSIGDDVAAWRRLLCLALYLALCVPLLFLQRRLWRRETPWWAMIALLLPATYALSIGSNVLDALISRALGWIAHEPLAFSAIVRGIDAFWLALAAFCAFHAVLSYAFELGQERAKAAEASTLLREAELRALRYQLQPHFLFNTLNAISSLVASGQVERSREVISRLADFLRAVLDENITHEVAVADEIALTETYLAIEKTRLAERLELRWQVGSDVLDKRIPCLLLQPLAENAIRHGIALRSQPGKLDIALTAAQDRLRICVRNDGIPAHGKLGATEPSSPLGLRNIAERLAALYGAHYRLNTHASDDGAFRVDIELPLRESASSSAPRWEAGS